MADQNGNPMNDPNAMLDSIVKDIESIANSKSVEIKLTKEQCVVLVIIAVCIIGLVSFFYFYGTGPSARYSFQVNASASLAADNLEKEKVKEKGVHKKVISDFHKIFNLSQFFSCEELKSSIKDGLRRLDDPTSLGHCKGYRVTPDLLHVRQMQSKGSKVVAYLQAGNFIFESHVDQAGSSEGWFKVNIPGKNMQGYVLASELQPGQADCYE